MTTEPNGGGRSSAGQGRADDRTADVVIVGAGAAGLTAAAEAATTGARVLILDKADRYGGSSAISGGEWAFAGTQRQQHEGIEDSAEDFLTDLIRVGGGHNVSSLAAEYAHGSAEAERFLSALDVPFERISAYPGHSRPRVHLAPANIVLGKLLDHALRAGATLELDTEVIELVQDSSARVVGVRTRSVDGRISALLAERGVVLATGGFASNPELLEAVSSLPLSRCISISAPTSTGDGLVLAQALGASTTHLGLGVSPGCFVDVETKALAMPHYSGAICLNLHGRRFVDESISYISISRQAIEQPDGLIVQIADDAIWRQAASDPLSAGARPVTAPTLTQLAPLVGLTASALVDAVNTYNSGLAAAEDRFGRTTLVGDLGAPVPIITAPFHGFPTRPAVLGTQGGLTSTTAAEVVDLAGNVIPGLYCAGEVMGGVHGAGYATGSQLGKAVVFGRIAGRNAAS